MVNNWYSILYSLANGLKPETIGHEDPPAAAAAAAKLLQSCPTLCDPIDGSPPGSLVPGILQARTLEWVAISFSNARKWKVRVKLLICVRLFETPWSAAYQAPLSVGFSRQENWSRLSLPSLKILLREYYSKKHYLRVIKLYKFLTSKPDTMQWHSGQFYFLNFCKKKKKVCFKNSTTISSSEWQFIAAFSAPLGTRFSGGHAITLRLLNFTEDVVIC